jgi:hypothetical protein
MKARNRANTDEHNLAASFSAFRAARADKPGEEMLSHLLLTGRLTGV